jgi:signal peptidase II
MTERPGPRRVWVRRAAAVGVAAAVAAADLAVKAVAESRLTGDGVRVGPLWLHASHNPGAAFSLGADAPAWVVPTVAAAVVAGIAVYAWRAAATATPLVLSALAVMVGGAANLADRAGDGVVTDYLDLGWWPSFNLADAALCLAVAVLLVASLFTPATGRSAEAATGVGDAGFRGQG